MKWDGTRQPFLQVFGWEMFGVKDIPHGILYRIWRQTHPTKKGLAHSTFMPFFNVSSISLSLCGSMTRWWAGSSTWTSSLARVPLAWRSPRCGRAPPMWALAQRFRARPPSTGGAQRRQVAQRFLKRWKVGSQITVSNGVKNSYPLHPTKSLQPNKKLKWLYASNQTWTGTILFKN
jgi:hypothetical protein